MRISDKIYSKPIKGLLMEILLLISYFIFFLIALILTFTSFKYFTTMWRFKNRKKDGSEDDNFKRFD